MSVIIRLQGLPWSASAMNIRHFFSGLSIPAGGVHIIGGEGGDAFIAFSSDDDARMAMKMNMCPLNGTPVQLFLSSKSEMQSVIDAARSGTAATPVLAGSSTTNTGAAAAPGMGANTGGHQSSVHNMSGGFTGMQGMNQSNQYGPVGGGFQNMQQRGDMSGGGGMGVSGKSEWQPMPGMMGAGGSDGGGQFNSNQRNMMGGDDNANRYPGYPDNRQHMNMQQGANVMGNQGQMTQGHMGMQGMGDRQPLGMDPSGQGDPMGLGRGGRFGDDMRAGNMGSNMNQKTGQFVGAEDREKTAAFMHGQMNMDIDSDPNKQGLSGGMMDMSRNRGMNDPMARLGFQGADGQGSDMMKERLSNQVMPGPPTSGSPGLGLGGPMQSPWVGDNTKAGGTFSDKQVPLNPNRKGESGDTTQGTSLRRDRPNRVNRFAEVPERPVQDSFNQPKRSNDIDFERDMRFPNRFHDGPKEQMDNMPPGRGFQERPPGERRGPIGDDGMPSTRYPPDDDDQFQEEGRFSMGRGGPNERRPPPTRYMPDDMRPGDESRMPHNDRGRFSNDDRGFGPNEGGRYPPHGDRYPDHDRRFPPDQRFMGNDRNFPPSNDRPYPGDDRRPPPGEGRFMPDDRPGMWQGERQRTDDMVAHRSGDNPFPPEDQRHRERDQELRRDAFERNRHGAGGEWPPNDHMHGGRMDYQGGQGNEDMGGKPFPPDRRGFSGDRHGGPAFREDERDFYGPPGRMEGRPESGPPRWNRGDSTNMDRHEMGGRGPFPPGNPDGPMGRPDRGPMTNAPPMDNEGPSDMDQRIGHSMYGNRRPGMLPNHGRGEGPTEGELGDGPHDFDNRAMGPRGGGMMMGERPPRGRGDPFNRGRPGTMSMGRGRGMEMDRHFEEGGPPRQDVDNRTIAGDRFAVGPNQGQAQSDMGPRPGMGKSLLGDGPQDLAPGKEPADRNKANESRSDSNWRDSDSRYSRRDSRDRDRRYDDRRGRDRDERDRYRSRYDRERERDRDRDRRRSRSRSRNRGGSRDKDRFGRDRSARDNSYKSENDSSRSTSTKKPEERPTRFLHVKNMPLTVSYRDVRRFFFPLEIPFDGLKLINDKEGNRNGEAFIYFHRLDDAVTAQKKNGDRNEGKVISVAFTTESEFTKAVDSYVPVIDKKESASVSDKRVPVSSIPMPPEPRNTNASNKPRFIAQLNNLPETITRQDINQFFKSLKIDKEGEAAYIEFDNNGVATGKGFVEFKTDVDYKRALTHNGSLLGTSKIVVIQGNAEEADKLKAVQGEMFQRAALRNLNKTSPAQSLKPGLMGARPNAPTSLPQQPAIPPVPTTPKLASTTPTKEESGSHETVCVHIQGLPLLATPRDIKDFFGDSQIALRGINIAHDSQGKPLGEGFVEFKFLSDFEKALKKDKTSMGRHIVAVKPIGKKEMLDKLENAKQQGAAPRSILNTTPPTSLNNQSKPSMPLVQQSPQGTGAPKPLLTPTSSNTSQTAPQGQAQVLPDNQSTMSNNQQNQSIPRPPGPSNTSEMKQPGPNPNPPNPRAPAPEMGKSHGPVMPLLQTPQPQVTMPGGGKSFPPGVLNSNWYYVRCQNFPPDISIGEIMNFFKTFRPLGESIRLHYSSEGHPTGNAVVGFASAEEATRALQCLNMRVCRHNVVTLHAA